MYTYVTVCINHPSPAKCNFWVQPKIAAKSTRGRYLVNVMVIMYGVLATLWRSAKRQFSLVPPGAVVRLCAVSVYG